MILALSSQMPYADRTAMLAFWGDHAMAHGTIASRLGSRLSDDVIGVDFGSGEVISSSLFDLSDQAALAQWVQGMADPDNAPPRPEALHAWLQAHQALHVAESSALSVTTPFDFSVIDVRSREQFLDWMDQHARLHQQESAALGGSA